MKRKGDFPFDKRPAEKPADPKCLIKFTKEGKIKEILYLTATDTQERLVRKAMAPLFGEVVPA